MTQQDREKSFNKQKVHLEDLERLRIALGPGPVLVLTHTNPDPDALASGKAFSTLVKTSWDIHCDLYYAGLVARAENRQMLRLLTPEWKKFKYFNSFEHYSSVVLLDTQPKAGNNRLPENQPAHVVIDHHHPLREFGGSLYTDIRPHIGATVTIMFQYLEAAGIQPNTQLATSMFYGLKTDTQGLSRGISAIDEEVYVKLLHSIDRKSLIKIEQAGLSRGYFQAFGNGLQAAEVCGSAGFASLGELSRPDLLAEIADLLIRLNDIQGVLCIGYFGNTLHLSLRTKNYPEDAGILVQKIVDSIGKAGGHGTMAGGQISIRNRDINQMVKIVRKRYLEVFHVEDVKCFRLLDSGDKEI